MLTPHPAHTLFARRRHAAPLLRIAPILCKLVEQTCIARREGAVSQAEPTVAGHDWDTSLHLPSWISQNERIQIEARLDQWVRDLVQVMLTLLTHFFLRADRGPTGHQCQVEMQCRKG